MNQHTPNYGYGQQPGPYGVPPQAPRPPKKKHTGAKIFSALAVCAVLTVGGCLAVVSNTAQEFAGDLPNTVPDTAQPTVKGSGDQTQTPKPPKPSPRTKEAVPAFLPKDGTLLVGEDVKPGTYRATAPEMLPGAGMANCYWARLRDTDGGLGSIITNQSYTTVGATATLTIKATDQAVEIRGCGTWKRIR